MLTLITIITTCLYIDVHNFYPLICDVKSQLELSLDIDKYSEKNCIWRQERKITCSASIKSAHGLFSSVLNEFALLLGIYINYTKDMACYNCSLKLNVSNCSASHEKRQVSACKIILTPLNYRYFN